MLCNQAARCNVYGFQAQDATCTLYDDALADTFVTDPYAVYGVYAGAC